MLATKSAPIARPVVRSPRRVRLPRCEAPLTLRRVTLVLEVPGCAARITACRVAGRRYVLCIDMPGTRPQIVTVARALLATWLRDREVMRLVARV